MTDKSLLKLTLWEAKAALTAGEICPTELTQAYLAQARQSAPLNIYTEVTEAQALCMAKESEARYRKKEALPLDGLPLAYKDLFCTRGVKTTACSKILKNFIPPYDSFVTQKLNAAGAVMLGKLNMDEFAMGSSNLSSAMGPCYNPWGQRVNEPHLVPGGSSGGSAAAVAAFAALGSLGTDTGGSVRQPASFCGVVGLKPTYGRCSRYGVVAFASSLDQPGPFARNVRDTALIFQHMAGHDPRETTSVNVPVPDYLAGLEGSIKGKRIGIPREYNLPGLDVEVKSLWERAQKWLAEAGAIIEEISLPHTAYALSVYYIIAPAEASSNLARYDGVRFGQRVAGKTLDELYEKTRGEGFGDEVQRRILIGTYVLSAGCYEDYYVRALKVRRLIQQDFAQAFKRVDMILTPSTTTAAFCQENAPTDPMAMYLNDVYTVTANLAGLPAMSVPAGLSRRGLPLGMQLIGPAFEEAQMLRMAQVIENKAQFPSFYEMALGGGQAPVA